MNTQSSLNWNLSEFYSSPTDPKIESDYQSIEKQIDQLVTHKGKLSQFKPNQLLHFIQDWEAVDTAFHAIDLYAGLLEATHIGVADITRFSKKVQERIINLYEKLLFIEVELSRLPEEKWQEFLHAEDLKPYHKMLEKIYRSSKHTLSESEERIMMQKSQTSRQALDHLFSITTDTLEFEWDNKKITLEELVTKFSDPNPEIRQQTAKTLHAGLNRNNITTPAIINSLVQDKAINDTLRAYSFPEEARYDSDDVDKDTVEALIAAVSSRYDITERYYSLKKKLLSVNSLNWWDRYAPLPKPKTEIELEAAKTMVLEAYQQFSPEMATMVENMIDKGHIDWLPSKTKRGGAFCADSGKEKYPFVLLNYTKSPRDVMTVAHELGHAIHDVFAQQENTFYQLHPSLALAEVASTFGEHLLFDKLISSPEISKEDRISLLMANIEDGFATVFRQVTMFQFEQQLHTKRRTEGELSKEEIDTLWDETMKRPFSSTLTYTEEHKNTWMYVGHIFHMPFYVYSYAFAQLCTLALVQQYKEQGSGFVPKYIEILKAGGSLSPKDNMARAGFDLTKPEFWMNGLRVIEQTITELEALVEK